MGAWKPGKNYQKTGRKLSENQQKIAKKPIIFKSVQTFNYSFYSYLVSTPIFHSYIYLGKGIIII